MRCKVRYGASVALLLCTAAVGLLLVRTLDVSVSLRRPPPSRGCSCARCLTEGKPCLAELLGEAPPPFLSRGRPISQRDFKWWKPIQGEKRNFTFYNQTLDKVYELFPAFAALQGPSPERCRSCAVVGNSGVLRGSRQGALIDRHNIVIRINRGRTEGFEADVGSKTTHRVMYPESRTGLDNATFLLFFPFKTNDFLWLIDQFRTEQRDGAKFKRIANKDLVTVLSPAFMRYVHESWLGSVGSYPSTGFMAIALSMFLCDEVHVFGFGANEDGNWDHYFETLQNKKLRTGGHPGSHEYKTIQQLHGRQILRFFKGVPVRGDQST